MLRYTSNLKNSKDLEIQSLTANSLDSMINEAVKRIFDFIVALIGLCLLSPFLLIISILIKRDSPGPVFYWGPRIGRHGRMFKMLKFRTMYETPQKLSRPPRYLQR